MTKHSRKIACLFCGITISAVFHCALAQTDSASKASPAPKSSSPESALERVLNYPFANEKDMQAINAMCQLLLSIKPPKSDKSEGSDTGAWFQNFLSEIAAFTSTEAAEGERFSIVMFEQSSDKAVQRLREEAHIAPPEGGAIVRVYQIKKEMPQPIHALFRGQVQGITRWCRFIAVSAEDKSRREIEDIISHELAHAYISSSLGLNDEKLPQWFHEGVALYLSDAKDQYVSQTRFGIERISWSPKDYEEYRLVFRYLDSTLGRQRVAEFIQLVVQGQSVTEPLRTVIGATSYDDLRARAMEWQKKREGRSGWLGLIVMFSAALILLLWWQRRRSRLREQIQREIERAEHSKQTYTRQAIQDFQQMEEAETFDEMIRHGQDVAQDLEKLAVALVTEGRALAKAGHRSEARKMFDQALHTAPQSVRVRTAVQQARNEMDGIVL